MAPSLLVLGGSSFVGRALVEEGLARRWEVATFNRGRGWHDARAERVAGDRLEPDTLAPLAEREWDLVADTWSGAPRAVRDGAALLAGRAGRYAYVSSESVYAPPPPAGGDESGPTVDPGDGDYAACKRGGELAERAHAAGLRCRPVQDTVADTWAWLCSLDGPAPLRADLDPPGLDPARERAVLARAGSTGWRA